MSLSYRAIYASEMYQTYLLKCVIPALFERLQYLANMSFDYDVEYDSIDGKAKIALNFIDGDIYDYEDDFNAILTDLTNTEFTDIRHAIIDNQISLKVML